MDREATKHLHNNLDEYMRGTINGSERCVFFTKWVGASWDEDVVNRSFEKCGISIPINGSMDDIYMLMQFSNLLHF